MRKPHVRALLLGASALMLFAATPVNAIAVAHADVDTYLSDMEAAGFVNGDGNAAEILVGKSICKDLAAGVSQYRAATDLWESSKFDSKSEAIQFVDITVRDLCPEFAT